MSDIIFEFETVCDECGDKLCSSVIDVIARKIKSIVKLEVHPCSSCKEHYSEEVYEEGRQDGLDEGYDEGYENGYEKGYEQGLVDSKNAEKE